MNRYRKSTAASALLLGVLTLSGCAAPIASDDVVRSAAGSSPVPGTTPAVAKSPVAKKPAVRKARIVYLRIAQKPKCAEGTAVFRADPVPLIIEWKITGATGGALSVDDPTNTPGTYGPVELTGSQEFQFSCSGEVGSKETHTYALYTVGGQGPVRSKTVKVSATVLDKGLGTN
ncbi:hypothetical protein M1L60_45845 [Actinoplanes sp. TRM 88003]|uniref:Lipoprotein n=1 Tax=Paractinoplanes aksuensis TaxID=2939490 RepID=A0ABT1E4I6_9ACTN|nr:hypothetical protein [Actinoplanes aksuensis]MCO8277920.1 hypothetical protein [Actinoplanes aksuensis]